MEIEIKDKLQSKGNIKIEPFKESIRKTQPHKHHKYFEIIYLYQGSGTHVIDNDTFEIKPPTMFFMRKDQLHCWDITSPPKGYVIILKKDFLENSVDKELEKLIAQLSNQVCVDVKEYEKINIIFELLVEEVANSNSYQQTIIEGLLKALFAKTLTTISPIGSSIKTNLPSIFVDFKSLLENAEVIHNSVHFYAEQLNTTPQNLNTICRQATGIAASKFIGEYIIKEAKRLLLYTSLPISEVAFKLDFKDTSHFNKYFKRNTEQTPSQFRNG
ncbi:helix-turn-helix domain-containing protein [Flammeovirga sp. SJP92]|uniref:AraC family transcriptional regulator n=1 Tax=Flammeovirga sp. SJP92 TaxID=1775430 RepID=UPI0007879A0F|nr:helix-turn-helix domain-containing protein [Flammeovirga sp. SJP92]KXX68257.1 hypothetical protein AVL50_20910 [Flammeovirga sp. SJP92]